MKKRPWRRYVIFFVKMSLLVGLGYVLYQKQFLTRENMLAIFSRSHLPFALLAAMLFLLSTLISTWRLLLLLKPAAISLNFFQGLRLTFIGFFFNLVLPGMIGGDVVKGYYLLHQETDDKGKSIGILVIDRGLGLLALLGIGCLSILYLVHLKSAAFSQYYQKFHVIILIAVGLLVVFPLIGCLVLKRQQIRRRLKTLLATLLGRSMWYYMFQSIGILTNHLNVLLWALVLSLGIQLLSLGGVLVLGASSANGLPSDIPAVFAISSIVFLLGIVPVTPGNVGWTELLAAYGWATVGDNRGAEIFFYWRMIAMLCVLPGGVFYLFMRHPDKQDIEAYHQLSSVRH